MPGTLLGTASAVETLHMSHLGIHVNLFNKWLLNIKQYISKIQHIFLSFIEVYLTDNIAIYLKCTRDDLIYILIVKGFSQSS